MTLPGLLAGSALALALLATIAAELSGSPSASSGIVPASTGNANRTATPALTEDHTDRWIVTSLQRPLFSPHRRPPVGASAPAGAAAPGLPRLAGTLVSGAGRNAIFAGEAGARSIVVGEGGKVGVWTVRAISAGEVAVSGPDGARTIRPTFDRNAPPPAQTAAAPTGGETGPGQPGLLISRRRPPVRPSSNRP